MNGAVVDFAYCTWDTPWGKEHGWVASVPWDFELIHHCNSQERDFMKLAIELSYA